MMLIRNQGGRNPKITQVGVKKASTRADLQTNDEEDKPKPKLSKSQRRKIKKQKIKLQNRPAQNKIIVEDEDDDDGDQAQQVDQQDLNKLSQKQAAQAEQAKKNLQGAAPGAGKNSFQQKLRNIISNYGNMKQDQDQMQQDDDQPQMRSSSGRRKSGGFSLQQQAKRQREREAEQQRAAYISGLSTQALSAPVLRKRPVNNEDTFKGLLKAQPQYNLNQNGYLQSFPQWIMGQQKKFTNKRDQGQTIVGINRGITDKQNGLFKMLAAMDGTLATWDQNISRWTGTMPKQIQGKINNTIKILTKKMEQGTQLLNTQASRRQIEDQVPTIVKQLVLYNQNLSNVGFGPISQNGLGLYAGRWLDPVTGKVRVLPNAKAKYINPASLPQKLGYLQAKILNHWNTFMATYQQYMRYSQMDQDKYRQKIAKSIKNGLDLGGLIIKYNNAINKIIVNYTVYAKNPMLPANMTEQILRVIGMQSLVRIYKLSGDVQDTASARADNALLQRLKTKQSVWETSVTDAQQVLSAQIGASAVQQSQKDKLLVDLNRTALRLIAGPGRSIANSIKKAGKILAIPDDLNENDLMRVAKSVDELQQSDNKFTSLVGRGYSQRNIAQLADAGEKLQKGINDKNYVLADSMLSQAKTTALIGRSSDWALQANKAPKLSALRRNVLANTLTFPQRRLLKEKEDRRDAQAPK